MVHPGGFEPPTARFVAEYSIQLSYGCIGITAVILISNFAICHSYQRMVHPGGFEPPTARFVAEYSIQLSYGCIGKLALLRVSVTTNTCHTEYDGLIGRVTRLCLALRAAAFTAFFSLNSERRWCIREDYSAAPRPTGRCLLNVILPGAGDNFAAPATTISLLLRRIWCIREDSNLRPLGS